jgi:hypothetical protein
MRYIMKIVLSFALAALCLGSSLIIFGQQRDSSAVEIFWSKFQKAVVKSDKETVASMTRLPLSMPYGMKSVKSKAQLMREYGKIFDSETRKCFEKARPEMENVKSKRFSISCGEAMMYWFELVRGEYKFTAVDNVNE